MEKLTDAQWKLLAKELRDAKIACDDALAAFEAKERDFASKLGSGGTIVIAGYRLTSQDGRHVHVAPEKVVA